MYTKTTHPNFQYFVIYSMSISDSDTNLTFYILCHFTLHCITNCNVLSLHHHTSRVSCRCQQPPFIFNTNQDSRQTGDIEKVGVSCCLSIARQRRPNCSLFLPCRQWRSEPSLTLTRATTGDKEAPVIDNQSAVFLHSHTSTTRVDMLKKYMEYSHNI